MKGRLLFGVCLNLGLATLTPLHAQSPRPEPVGQRADAPVYAKHGPYWVGVREVILQADGGRSLATTIWYPAVNPKGAKETGTIKETTVRLMNPNITLTIWRIWPLMASSLSALISRRPRSIILRSPLKLSILPQS
jgi:hypothetical protein